MNIKDYWSKKHKNYSREEWITKPSLFAQYAIDFFPENGKLLELGAGQGQDSRYFAKNGFAVLATDFSEEALKSAKHLAKTEKLKMNFKLVNLQETLPFNKESFEIVYSHLAVQYFDSKRTKKLFDEMSGVLKKGGVLALLLNTMDDPEVQISKKLEEGLYETPSGLVKRFFTISYLKKLTAKHFETLVIDNKGVTYKDSIKTLIRFIGRKI